MILPPSFIFYAMIAFILLLLYHSLRRCARRGLKVRNPRGLPYPPGPRPFPVIGNLMDLAQENEVAAYLKLANHYGDMVFLSALGKSVLLVNSFQVANDLFEKRSANYSDRDGSTMMNELIGWDWSFGLMRYGERWRIHRKMFHRQFQLSAAHHFWSIQRGEALMLVRNILHSPQQLVDHLRHNAASMIMRVIYGITVAPQDDHYITLAEKALEGMSKAANPGAFLVDMIPSLKYVPEWMPGAGFRRKAREWRCAVIEMRDAPFAHVLSSMQKGKVPPCFVANLVSELGDKEITSEDLETIKGCAGLAYTAATESTACSLSSFVLAMVAHPEILKKAHEELDKVVGYGRLPIFTDRPHLPYINAILKEVLRWNPVAPLGLPHMSTEDDEYNGYFIPARTTIVGNTWAILHDPSIYPEPSRFDPDRFMDKDDGQQFLTMDPLSSAFGYGRRICPGRYMAEAQLWISIACMLSTFNIGPKLDGQGNRVETVPRFSSGFISRPLTYDFSITPRGEYVKSLIEEELDLNP